MKILLLIQLFLSSHLWAQTPPVIPTKNNAFAGGGGFYGVMGGNVGGAPPADYFKTQAILLDTPGYPSYNLEHTKSLLGRESDPQLIESYDTGIRGLIGKIPNSQLRSGLEKYLDIINARSYRGDSDVGSSNQGLAEYHQQTLSGNPCFATLAENFYSEILKIEADAPRDHPLHGRPSLAEEAGSGRFDHLAPGWLMEKALEATNGNANLAIELIGLCGHDDVSQSPGGIMGFNYRSMIEKESPNLESINEALDFEIKNAESIIVALKDAQADDNTLISKEERLAKLREFKEGVNNGTIEIQQTPRRNIGCPRNNSPFYAAKSLGEEVDLSDEQKRRIEVIQAPTKGRGYLPAKNYHFMGSAFMACKLVQEGVSPGTATLVQKTAAWAYRTIRINTKLREDLEVIDELDELYETFVEEFHEKYFEFVNSQRGMRRRRLAAPSFDTWMHAQVTSQSERYRRRFKNHSPTAATLANESSESNDLDERIPILENFPSLSNEFPIGTISLQDIANWRVQYDAAKVLDDLSLGGGSLFGNEIPHTNLGLVINFLNDPISRKVTMADLVNDPNRTTPIRPRRSRGYPRSWSRERYQLAHDKALTYLIDWEWTTNQHEIGASFGSQQCTRQDPGSKPDDQACLILGERPDVLCNLKQLDAEQSRQPVFGKANFLGSVSDKMLEQYLDPGIESTSTDGIMSINGAF